MLVSLATERDVTGKGGEETNCLQKASLLSDVLSPHRPSLITLPCQVFPHSPSLGMT